MTLALKLQAQKKHIAFAHSARSCTFIYICIYMLPVSAAVPQESPLLRLIVAFRTDQGSHPCVCGVLNDCLKLHTMTHDSLLHRWSPHCYVTSMHLSPMTSGSGQRRTLGDVCPGGHTFPCARAAAPWRSQGSRQSPIGSQETSADALTRRRALAVRCKLCEAGCPRCWLGCHARFSKGQHVW